MALVNLPTTGGPQVLSQYQYEPYGLVAAADNGPGVNDDTENTAGHQGLFFHRLNTGVPSLSPGAAGLYYNRNRWYAPHLGRFLTRDPKRHRPGDDLGAGYEWARDGVAHGCV